jgi:uncharacterized membrane protein YkvA (DUF1232 family)
MPEIANYVRQGAIRITPRVVQNMLKFVGRLKLEFAQAEDPKFPHLSDQLQFLLDFVEDFVDGKLPDAPYVGVAAAAFAILYAHRKIDLIPDFVTESGHADDSAIVRAVLINYEFIFVKYAKTRGIDWNTISVQR